MRSTAQLATIGHLTAGPATNVDSRVDVRVECEAALQAGKLVLGLSVLLGGMPRVRALAVVLSVSELTFHKLTTHNLCV